MRRYLLLTGAVAWGIVVCGRVAAQDNAGPLVKQIAGESAEYRRSLPNFSCEEEVKSSGQVGRQKFAVKFRAVVRVVRSAEGKLSEEYALQSYMGKPTTAGERYPIPTYVEGGFGRGVPLLFADENQRCFLYKEGRDRVQFQSQPGVSGCLEPSSTKGVAYVDAAGQLQRGETHREPMDAVRAGMTTLTKVDYGTVELGGKDYRLPVKMYAEIRAGNLVKTFEAKYSGCELYKVSVTVKTVGEP